MELVSRQYIGWYDDLDTSEQVNQLLARHRAKRARIRQLHTRRIERQCLDRLAFTREHAESFEEFVNRKYST